MTHTEKDLLGDKNRRRFFRHACDASVTTAFEYDRKDRWNRNLHAGYLKSDAVGQSHLRVLNVSEGGIALLSRFPAAKGAALSVRIRTAFDTEIRARARVAWAKRLKGSTDTHVLGLQFTDMSREDARNLEDLLKVLEESRPSRARSSEPRSSQESATDLN
ncbi:MAG: PilZ domain-containing protein [Candidatus Lindowbacteria bacterium]|nr:PilZ domain-containing protein [Candidatus Lindowbacteria bacterium]